MTPEERKEKIEEMAGHPASEEAADRKERSNARLRAMGVRVAESLPYIEDSTEVEPRSVEEIAHRAVAIFLTAIKGEGQTQEDLLEEIEDFGASGFFSPEELTFINNPAPEEMERIQFCWGYEKVWVLLWALGYVAELGAENSICDVALLAEILRDHGTEPLIAEAKPVAFPRILDEADLIYRAHWAVREARVRKRPAPEALDGGVVMERHWALNWLIRYMDQDWDKISTDT